jgi:L-fucose isomerase-like protein
VLWIRDNARHEEVLERLGTKVRSLPRRCFNERFDRTPETAEVRSVAKRMRRVAKRVVEPAEQDLRNAARTLVTAKELLQEEGANALSMDCLGMVGSRLVPTPPCMAWSILQDVGVTAGCEADLFGAVSLLFTSYLFDKPGFINDPVPETRRNLLIASHCTCGTRLRGFAEDPVPVILRSHSESDKGVSMQVLWPKGEPVTLVRFNGPHDLILDSGVVEENVDTPPAGGCRTSFEIRMDGVRDARDVEGFHQVVFLGNHRREVEAFAQLYGITVRNSA